MSDEGEKQLLPPTAELLERALLALLLTDRRRRWREYAEELRWEALMDEARGLIPGGTDPGEGAAW